MFYIIFDLSMSIIMLLFGIWFYRSEGKACKFFIWLQYENLKMNEKNMMKKICVRDMEKECYSWQRRLPLGLL